MVRRSISNRIAIPSGTDAFRQAGSGIRQQPKEKTIDGAKDGLYSAAGLEFKGQFDIGC